MTRYLPWEKLSPLEASKVHRASPSQLPWLPREITFPAVDNGSSTVDNGPPLEAYEVPRASPSELPWLPWEITFPAVDNGSYTPLRSDLSYTYQCQLNKI